MDSSDAGETLRPDLILADAVHDAHCGSTSWLQPAALRLD